jgi:phage tail sheath protein FI
MPVALSYPGVYIQEVPSGVRTIAGVATSIALFIGWAARGPTTKATRIFSFADYERAYGGLDRNTLLGYAVKHFFDNGGTDAYVVRIAKDAVAAKAKLGDLSFTAGSPGKWGNAYGVRIVPRTDTEAKGRFKLEVTLGDPDPNRSSPVVESFESLSTVKNHPRFVEAVVNGRSEIVTVAASSETAPGPANNKLGSTAPDEGTDGTILSPSDGDFKTAVTNLFEDHGIVADLDLFNLVCVPGETDPATIKTLQTKCAARRAFLVVDCEKEVTFASMSSGVANYIGPEASYSALYFPWVLAADPLQQGAVRAFPPCGYVAGVMARTDARRGVWKAPAGTDAALTGMVGFEQPLDDKRNGVLNIKAVNCLRTLPVYGNVVWGARTLEGDNDRGSEWRHLSVRRMALFLEESLYRGTQWVVFEPNDEPLWAQIRLNIGAFMQTLFRQGAFQGTTPREAYFVKCDRTTTTQADINNGIVNIHVGFAPLKPAEFVVIHIQQMAGEIPT